MTSTDFPRWFKSSYSDNGGNCIEIAANLADTHGIVPIRDSKTPHGPVVTVSPTAWSAFVAFT
ncbi:toxin-antitoxin system, toxin component, partial [Streptomyces varsoviensis]